MSILIIQADFNRNITDILTRDCINTLESHGFETTLWHVPGALEIPQKVAKAIRNHNFEGIIAIGCIIRGDTYHFEIVSNESARGLMNISLTTDTPLLNGILTCNTEEQAIQRTISHGTKESTTPKGVEWAQAMITMLR